MRRPPRALPRWRQVAGPAAGAATVLGLLVFVLSNAAATTAVRRAFAVVTSGVLNLLGNETVSRGTEILSKEFGISVVTACTGLFVAGLFLAAVVAFPTSWRARLVGVAVGIVALFVVNVVRLASLYYIGRYWRSALEPAHQLVWQSLVIAIAVVLWLVWAGLASARTRRAT